MNSFVPGLLVESNIADTLLGVYVPFLLPRNITLYFENETSRHFSTLYVGGGKQKELKISLRFLV